MEPSEQATELLHLLRCCGHYLHHHWGSGKVSQDRTLRILGEHGALTQRQLQDLMGIQQGSLSELVKKLESQNLVVRERTPDDQRQFLIQITEKGMLQNQANRAARLHQGQELVSALSGEEQENLLALLTKLHDSWVENRSEGEPPHSRRHQAERKTGRRQL